MADEAKRVLIVEDEEMLATTLKDMLSDEGYSVDVASDGETALEKAREMKPHLILLDIILPKMDGLSMFERLQEDETDGESQTEVIILTNLSDRSTVMRAIENNAYDYLVKTDWDLNEVITKVKEKLETP
jgi:response regulator NasT